MRRLIAFDCGGAAMLGTLDEAPGETGLLIVSGGNEIRVGAHRGQALLAAEIAAAGHPVFRYDRRGIGDSEGDNGGFESSRPDLRAAVTAFRQAAPELERIVAFGNCDAASALALWAGDAGIDALVLANPWVIEPTDDLPPAAAIRARYAERLRDPAEWKRLLTGGVDLGKLAQGLRRSVSTLSTGLASRIAIGLRGFAGAVTVLTADRDNTAIAFSNAWQRKDFDAVRDRVTEHRLASASHSFASPEDHAWLRNRVLKGLGQCSREGGSPE